MNFELLSSCFCDAPSSVLVLADADPERIRSIIPTAEVTSLVHPGQYCLIEDDESNCGEGDILMSDAAEVASGKIPSGEPCAERPILVAAKLAGAINSRVIAVWGSDHGEANFGLAEFFEGSLQRVIVAEPPEKLRVRAAYLSEDSIMPEPLAPDEQQHYRWPEKSEQPGSALETIDSRLAELGFNEDEIIELTG